MARIEKLHVQGFKSIRDREIDFRPLNVLIGANGAGKSNLLEVFRLLTSILEERLQLYVGRAGGADALLHFGRAVTDQIELRFDFAPNAYACRLVPTDEDSLIFEHETVYFQGTGHPEPFNRFLGSGHPESRLPSPDITGPRMTIGHHVKDAILSWRTYHFHDTSDSAKVKQAGDIEANHSLRADAGNLAAYLYRLKKTDPIHYTAIVESVRLAAPFFDDFVLRPNALNPDLISLRWRDKGSTEDFSAAALSDGTLRFICLATLLQQPRLPSTVILDEPELGLHPYAIHLLTDLLRSAAEQTQVLVSTQSVTLVNQLEPEEVLVVDREGDESVFRRCSQEDVAAWLDDYALGELWEKNVLGGRPGR